MSNIYPTIKQLENSSVALVKKKILWGTHCICNCISKVIVFHSVEYVAYIYITEIKLVWFKFWFVIVIKHLPLFFGYQLL